jgi:HK97 family phage portal protein
MQIPNAQPSRLAVMSRALAGVFKARGQPEAHLPDAQPPDTKASATRAIARLEHLPAPVWSPRDTATFAREGMMQNPVVYRCIRMVAEATAAVPLLLYDGDSEISDHSVQDVLARPSPGRTYVDLIESLVGFLLVSGNAYGEAVAVDGRLRELHSLRPDRIQILPGADGWSDGYRYTVDGRSIDLAGEVAPGIQRILHLRHFHPLDDHYGLSPLEAAATAVDIHNEASRWNKALLDNSARPSGALVYGASEAMSPAQFDRLKRELEESFSGARNAGRPLLLEGGLDWRAMSLSPRDMDFIALKQMAAREIALALGVPPLLLGLPGDNTYTNYQEANRTFWRQTVIPLAMRLARALSGWLLTADDGRLQLRCNLDDLDALSADREALWARLDGASFLTVDEKRAAAGYGPMAEGTKFNPHHDEAGRFTFAPGGSGDATDPPDRVTTPLPHIADPEPPRPTPVAGGPKGPVGPKPPLKTPVAPPPKDRSNEPLKDIMMPGGKELGVKNSGAGSEVRTLSKSDLEKLKSDLTAGAKEVPAASNYAGKWYQRSDGTIIGVRESVPNGTTIDVIRSTDRTLKPGYKVHSQ